MSQNLLSDYLKEHTKKYHDDVEAKFESRKIFDKSYTLDDYRKILLFNYLFHLNYENIAFEKIDDTTAQAIHLNDRRKLHLLEKDLKNLGLKPQEINPSITVNSEAEAMGILYVMEGSSLGGNVIKKQLLQNSEFKDLEFHYFGCYAEKTGENWKNFKEVLDAQFHPSQYEEVLAGTNKAYNFLKNL